MSDNFPDGSTSGGDNVDASKIPALTTNYISSIATMEFEESSSTIARNQTTSRPITFTKNASHQQNKLGMRRRAYKSSRGVVRSGADNSNDNDDPLPMFTRNPIPRLLLGVSMNH